jgi:hypothetical protein
MKTWNALLSLGFVVTLSLLLASCGGSGNNLATAPVTKLSISGSSLPVGQVNAAYSATMTAIGGTAPYTWSVASGSLPAGLSLSAVGVITGTPTASGASTFTAQVSDAEPTPQLTAAQVSITIRPPAVSITTSSLAAGATTVSYTGSFSAEGGIAPYTWRLTAGELPSGLSLAASGAITGIPTTTGVFPFTVQVSDGESPPQIAAASFTIAITERIVVSTEHYDNFRSGQNLNEVILTPATVASPNFQKLFSIPVDGYIYAQPLYVGGMAVPGKGTHNVLYVATEHDSVYALDADSNTGQDSAPLWQTSFLNPSRGITTVSAIDFSCNNLEPEVGITSTPVIDLSTSTIYVVAETKENGDYFQRLHALDITTGAEKFGGPIEIKATYPGTGDGNVGGTLTFDPLQELNRPGLLLSQGNIYITWASNCDLDPFHGWVIAYNKATLQQVGVWVTTADGRRGGVWMSGGGMAADASGNLFLASGNGTFETSGNPADFGDSVVRLAFHSHGISLTDYFTPYDEATLDQGDKDLGSGGVLLLPDQLGDHVHELIAAGKGKTIYVVDRDNLGHFHQNDNSQIVQSVTGQVGSVFAVPTYWNNYIYLGGVSDHLKAFALNNGLLSSEPTSESNWTFTYPSASTSISANGTQNGIVWAIQSDQYTNNGNDILFAFDAKNLAKQLYGSTVNPDRDNPGPAAKFQIPTVANGKVYVGSATQVSVYGLLTPQ